jgi:hypothetical protein
MPTKYNQKQVEEIFEKENCKLNTIYKNNSQTLLYICNCGNEGKTNLRSFMKGSRCKECAKIKRKNTMKEKFGVECNLTLQSVKDKNKLKRKYKSKKCENENCTKLRQARSAFCISHGGGKRCEYEDCKTSVRGADKFCVKHGGGKRCEYENCKSSAINSFKFCITHGGGHKCEFENCKNIRKSGYAFCYKHCVRETKLKRNKDRKLKFSTDINYRLRVNLQGRFYGALKGLPKANTIMKLLGCSMLDFRSHIEKLFTDGMTWDNYGLWEIDHIKPCSKFDFSFLENQKLCFHYTNTQPLWKFDNRSKGIKEM